MRHAFVSLLVLAAAGCGGPSPSSSEEVCRRANAFELPLRADLVACDGRAATFSRPGPASYVDEVGDTIDVAPDEPRLRADLGLLMEASGEDCRIPTGGWPLAAGEVAFEFTPRWTSVPEDAWLLDTRGPRGGIVLHVSSGGRLNFLLRNEGADATLLAADLTWEEDRTYELRASWTPTTAALLRDGEVVATSDVSPLVPNGHLATASLGHTATRADARARGWIRDLTVVDRGDAGEPRLVCLGDSITYGRPYASEPYPARLQALVPDALVLQQGISGNTTDQLLARWGGGVRFLHPETVVVLGGANDLRRDWPADVVYANLAAVYEQALSDGARVVAVTVLPFGGDVSWTPARQEQLEALNERIRATPGVAVADAYAALSEPGDPSRLRASYDFGDGLHLNDAGAAALAEQVAGGIPR